MTKYSRVIGRRYQERSGTKTNLLPVPNVCTRILVEREIHCVKCSKPHTSSRISRDSLPADSIGNPGWMPKYTQYTWQEEYIQCQVYYNKSIIQKAIHDTSCEISIIGSGQIGPEGRSISGASRYGVVTSLCYSRGVRPCWVFPVNPDVVTAPNCYLCKVFPNCHSLSW